MNRVYLLLRDNIESGPFTIDELIQQQLNASDLVWVEGKSLAWNYPYELQELQHVVPVPEGKVITPLYTETVTEPVASKEPISPSSIKTAEEIEAKAERIRLQTIHFAQQPSVPYFARFEESNDTAWSPRENIQFIHHTRKKYVTLPQLMATGLITVLLASAWYGDWSMIRVKPNMVTVAAAPAAFNEDKPLLNLLASMKPLEPLAETAQDSIEAASFTTDPATAFNQLRAGTNNPATSNQQVTTPENTTAFTEETADTRSDVTEYAAKKENTEATDQKETKKETVAENNQQEQVEKKQPEKQDEKPTVEEPKEEKKKKLGQVIKGIFKKKDKEE
jgi:hypothetical protein